MTQSRKITDSHQKATKIYYGRNAHAINSLSPRQLVLLKDMHHGKLDYRYPEVCQILKKLHSHQYLIQRLSDKYVRKANISQLKPYVQAHPSETPTFVSKQTQTQRVNEPEIQNDEPLESASDVDRWDTQINLPKMNPASITIPQDVSFNGAFD